MQLFFIVLIINVFKREPWYRCRQLLSVCSSVPVGMR